MTIAPAADTLYNCTISITLVTLTQSQITAVEQAIGALLPANSLTGSSVAITVVPAAPPVV